MSESTNQAELLVRIENNGQLARLIIPGDFDPLLLNISAVEAVAEANSVELSAEARAAVVELIERFKESPCLADLVLAEAQPAKHGQDGRVEWAPGFNPDEDAAGVDAKTDANGRVDHRSRTSYKSVAAGERIATVIPPTEGEDGRDVTGRTLAAKSGQKAKTKFGANIAVDEATGEVTAAIAGLFVSAKGQVGVTPIFEVPGAVDFSTGNIDFKGSVEIKEGICGRFLVRATENIVVGGLIEAATIECGKNFFARTGIAARDRGDLRVGGQAEVGFLNDVRGLIKGDLLVRREVMNCRLVIGGSVLGDAAAIIGGELSVGNTLKVARLGTDGGTRTIISMGGAPLLAIQIKQYRRQQQFISARLDDLRNRHDSLRVNAAALNSEERARLTELSSEIAAAEQELSDLSAKIAEAEGSIARLAKAAEGEILISKMILPQVQIRIAGKDVIFEKELKGPVRIGVDDAGRPTFRQGNGATRPLSEVATVLKRAA